ncbi:MAG TPA: heme-binding beta-barrel domain-containing protein [Acidimicrobiia bacterium]|nr:heme-binding beta-barrel domain-containing protein [Acidimicrobiia bacterium]
MVHDYGSDLYTEADGNEDTLANLGPLGPLAGIWTSAIGADVHPVGPGSDIAGPVIDGSEHNTFVEHYELQPIDPQTNGPQLFYGLRYHTHIVKPGEVETFHDQVGYWLWEPAAHTVVHTLAIPRGQVVLASGAAEPDATEFEVSAQLGSEVYGILSNPFLDRAFQTVSVRIRVSVHGDGTWSYEEHAALRIPDRDGLIDHVDRNTLTRIAEPTPNPLAAAASPGPASPRRAVQAATWERGRAQTKPNPQPN